MTFQMIFPFVHFVAVDTSVLYRLYRLHSLYSLYLTVHGSNMSHKVFRIKERSVAELALVAAHLFGVVDDHMMAAQTCQRIDEVSPREGITHLRSDLFLHGLSHSSHTNPGSSTTAAIVSVRCCNSLSCLAVWPGT